MKKIFALILCLMLLCATPLVAFAEGETTTTEEAEPNWTEVKDTVSDTIVNWIIPHIEEISVIITLVLSCFYQMRKHKLLNKSVGTLNNNAITVAEKSTHFMSQALSNIENASGAVVSYDSRITSLLDAYRDKAEKEAMLEKELVEIKNYLKIATQANIEFANELAELLALANIPNFKKEELGSRHLEAVKALLDAEERAEAEAVAAAKLLLPANTEEVNEDVGEEKNN